jgi:hypothetical protein
MGLRKAKPKYIAYTLTFWLLIVVLVSFSLRYSSFPATTLALACFGLYLAWIILYQPYCNCRDNLAVFSNSFMVVAFLSWNILRDVYPILSSE